jgi:hypothetical protein
MKKSVILTVLIMSLSLVFFSFAKASKNTEALAAASRTKVVTDSSAIEEKTIEMKSEQIYQDLQLAEVGLNHEALTCALAGYEKLDSMGKINNPLLTIVDFSQSSRNKRLYILDMKEQKLIWNTFVSHGKNSGVDMAQRFSNAFNSEASSLGFYITKGTYNGKHGLSLRLSGQEPGFNDNAEARGVVVHGANYVNAGRVNSDYMGRSQGCPALPENEYAAVISMIKDGSVMFLYHPSENYLDQSAFLN